MNLNKVILAGRVASAPEARTTTSGQTVTNFRMATNRVWIGADGQKHEQTEFHSIVFWGKLAETASRFLTVGSLFLVEGRLQTRSWQDTSGNNRYRTEIIGEKMQLGPKNLRPTEKQSQTEEPLSQLPKTDDLAKEEIPIIEDIIDENEEEINVKDIPF